MIQRSQNGHPLVNVTNLLTLAALKALDVTENVPGERFDLTDNRKFYYHATSTAVADDVVVVAPTTGAGRYIITAGVQNLPLAFTFATADAAALLTLPTGMILVPIDAYWEITTGCTGGSSSAIGMSSSNSGFSTKGDLLGGATGDVAATLVAGTTFGTAGAKLDTIAHKRVMLVAGDTVRYDRITSVFTAGAGNGHLVCNVLAGPTA